MCDVEKSVALARSKGKFKTGKSCLYLDRLSDIETKVIEDLIKETIAYKKNKTSKPAHKAAAKKK